MNPAFRTSFAVTVAALFVGGCSKTGESAEAASAASEAPEAASADVKCLGINACKGQAQCGGSPRWACLCGPKRMQGQRLAESQQGRVRREGRHGALSLRRLGPVLGPRMPWVAPPELTSNGCVVALPKTSEVDRDLHGTLVRSQQV